MEELYALDFEDIIDGLKTRFSYAKVGPGLPSHRRAAPLRSPVMPDPPTYSVPLASEAAMRHGPFSV